MELISKIRMLGFRSIKDDALSDIKSFTSLAGLNNSGKSNYLRALNLFFNGEVEPSTRVDISNDYYRPDLYKKRKKKEIKIEVTFNLPPHFKFHTGLEEVRALLNPPSFTIAKGWGRGESSHRIYLNYDNSPLTLEQQQKVEQFLSLISFRYIPNRVLPIEIIKKEHQALRDVLIRRVSKKKPQGSQGVFQNIADTSKRLIVALHKHLEDTIPNFDDIRLATPTSFADMIFAFGYKLKEQGFEIDDSMQGSGIQSFLMFDTLYLIDKDYFQKFGWKQAAIWAIEEPESSLHCSLEASIASFLNQITNEPNSRLQVILTTHSEMIIQYSDKCFIIEKTKIGSKSSTGDISQILENASKLGVSPWSHPLLQFPLSPLILVEGKRDALFLNKAIELLNPKVLNRVKVNYLEKVSLANTTETGGVDALIKYIKNNVKVIKNRSKRYPVVLVLDWDAKNRESEIKRYFAADDPFKICIWPEEQANPRLGNQFRGTERFLSDRIIEEVKHRDGRLIFENRERNYTINLRDYEQIKQFVTVIIESDLQIDDLVYAKDFINNIIQIAQQNS